MDAAKRERGNDHLMSTIHSSKLIKLENRIFEVTWSDQTDDPAWDDFVVSVPDGHHEQTSLWGQVRAKYGWKIARYVLREHGRIIAGAQAQLRPIGRFGHVAYIPYGPCINTDEGFVAQICVAELKRLLHGQDVIYATVGLPYTPPRGLVKILEGDGFIRKPRRLHPHFLERTLVIDLTKHPEEILAEMRPSTRRNIRHALKKGITVVEGTAKNIGTFRELMLALCKRRNITPNPAQEDFFQQLWNILNPRGWVKLFIAKYDEEPVSAAIAFPFGKWVRIWKVGWTGKYGGLKPNEAMWWAMISYAHKNGYRHFDFVDIDPDTVIAGSAGSDLRLHIENENSFKLGFGGEIKVLPGAYCYFPNPILRMAVRNGCGRFLDSEIFYRLTQMYDKRLHSSTPHARVGYSKGRE